MTPKDKATLRNGAFSAALWGGAVALGTGGTPTGLLIAAIVALASGLFSTGLRLPAGLIRDGFAACCNSVTGVTRLRSASVPVKYVVPMLLATAFAGRGCDGIDLPNLPEIKWPTVTVLQPTPPTPPADKATAATYVFEKDQHAVPGAVLFAFNRLNRERQIVATVLEADTTDGTGDVPEQYRVAVEEAKKAGLPALVVTAGNKVLSVVKNPATEQDVMEAVQ